MLGFYCILDFFLIFGKLEIFFRKLKWKLGFYKEENDCLINLYGYGILDVLFKVGDFVIFNMKINYWVILLKNICILDILVEKWKIVVFNVFVFDNFYVEEYMNFIFNCLEVFYQYVKSQLWRVEFQKRVEEIYFKLV